MFPSAGNFPEFYFHLTRDFRTIRCKPNQLAINGSECRMHSNSVWPARCGLPGHYRYSTSAWKKASIKLRHCSHALHRQSPRSFDFLCRPNDYRRWLRDRVDDGVDGRHNDARRHSDDTWRRDLLAGLDKGLPAMLQANQTHCDRMQTLRWRTRVRHCPGPIAADWLD